MPFFHTHFGNPSSNHWAGISPKDAVKSARRGILAMLGVSSALLGSIWFTSCGTEADNLAIHLALKSSNFPKPHIVTSNIEHPAVEACIRQHEANGACTCTRVPVQSDGRVLEADMIAAIRKETCLVTLMLANNEVGSIQPVSGVARYCRTKSILFHTDAAQAVGKVSVTIDELGNPDMITIVGHKFGAPKGIACLYVRRDCLSWDGSSGGELIVGGGQEFGRRGGTENVPYIVGLGKAAEIVICETTRNRKHMERLRNDLLSQLQSSLQRHDVPIHVYGPSVDSLRLPNTLFIGISGLCAKKLLSRLGHSVAASAGSACHSDSGVSPVLKAMKVEETVAKGSLRLSVGPHTSRSEVRQAANLIAEGILEQLCPQSGFQ